MTRICMIAYTHYPTDSRVRREANALVERGDMVDFICLDSEGGQSVETLDGVRLIKIRISRYRGDSTVMYLVSYLQFFVIATFKLLWLQLKNPYAVIQVHTMPDFMIFVAIFPKLFGAKVLLDVHDLMPELYQSKFGYKETHPLIRFITWMERCSIAFADQAIAVHKPHLDALCRHGNPNEKFTILLNLPDHGVFGQCEPSLFSSARSDFQLIYHGTVSKRHGLEIAIRAVSALKEEINGLVLKIIGDGDDLPRLAVLVNELELNKFVQIHIGMIPMKELIPKIKIASVGIVPILYDDFTKYMLPVKLLEYVALGIPVICSRTPTIESYFDDTMVQYTSPGDVDELAAHIRFLYKNPDRRKVLCTNSSKFNRDYSWEKQKLSYYKLIDSLTGK